MARLTGWLAVVGYLLTAAPAAGQGFYMAAAAGHQFREPDARVLSGEMGVRFGGPLGLRVEGFETISLLFLGPSVTVALPAGDRLEPYVLAGGGGAVEMWEPGRLWLQGGAGVEWPRRSAAKLSVEGALIALRDDTRANPTLVTLRVGVRLHPFAFGRTRRQAR